MIPLKNLRSLSAKAHAIRPVTSVPLSSVQNGGEGWGEEALGHGASVGNTR